MQTQIFSQIGSVVQGARRVLIVSHIVPDGDTVGSALGLSWALRERGLEVTIACADPIPPGLAFLPGVQDYCSTGRSDEEAIFVVDSSDTGRMGAIYDPSAFSEVPVINIDHHPTNELFGDINLVASRASTAELVLDLLCYLDTSLNATIATCLLTGLITDTRCFRTSSTTTEALHAAVELSKAGAPLTEITDAVFNHRSLSILRVWGPALSSVRHSDGLVWTAVSQRMLQDAGQTVTAAGGLANYLSTFHETQAAVVFREQADGTVDVSMRSIPGIDVAEVALGFGGGGHAQAAGCTVEGPLDEVTERVLAVLSATLGRALGHIDLPELA